MNQVLNAQVTEQRQVAPYERSEQRQGYRNGYKPRQLTTRVGALTLLVPQVRDGAFSTELFARYQRSEQALVLTLMEMVVNGVSTRKVARITEELCGTSFAKSAVSDSCKTLDPLVTAWNDRDLSAQRFPFVLVNALVVNVREEGRVRAVSALVATGVNEAGYREVLGLRVGNSESERTWQEFFTWLKGRGLSGVDLVVSDHHGGLVKAALPMIIFDFQPLRPNEDQLDYALTQAFVDKIRKVHARWDGIHVLENPLPTIPRHQPIVNAATYAGAILSAI